MRVLITNIWLVSPGGTEVYVRDLAISLHQKGLLVDVYSPELGAIADEIKYAGVNVVNSVKKLTKVPDIIHGHHTLPTLDAITRFPNVPVIYFSNDRLNPIDKPPKHSQIIKYIACDYHCLDRLIVDEKIPKKDTGVFYNWVDTAKFKLRKRWSSKPRRALLFSNYANADNYYKAVRDACQKTGIDLDYRGRGMGNSVANPENILGNYDLVFAKAKAAMEAMATGAQVILCDYAGLGPIVTTQNFAYLRKYNFGLKALTRPHDATLIAQEIKKYDSKEAAKVARLIRHEASFTKSVDQIISIYKAGIKSYRSGYRIYNLEGDSKTLAWYKREEKKFWRRRSKQKNLEVLSVHQRLSRISVPAVRKSLIYLIESLKEVRGRFL